MNEYYNKEYYNQIKGSCAFIELNPDNVKKVMRALYDSGINFSAVYGGYRNTVTVSKDDEVRARTIANEHRDVNRFNQRVIGNTDYRSIKDRNYINTTPEIALQVSAILSGDSKVSFSGVIKERSATLTVSGAKNAEMVNRIIDNIRNADILNAMSHAGFERLPDNNGFVVIRNTAADETAGFRNMAMVRDMWNDSSNEFFHTPSFSVDKAAMPDTPFYISETDGQNERNVIVEDNMTAPMFPTEEAAESYAADNGIPIAQHEEALPELSESDEPEIKGNPVIDINLDLIDKFDKVGELYPDVVYYDDRAECFTWLHYDEYAAPDGALVEKTFTEEDVFAAYKESIEAENEVSARDMFISAVNDKAEKVNILVNDPAFTESADIYMNSIEYGNALSVFSVYEDGKADINAGKFIEYLEKNTAAVREDKARREQEDAKNAVIRSCYDRLKIAVLENEAVKNAVANTDFQNAHIEALDVMSKEALNIFNENIYGNIDFYADFFGGKMTENRIALEEEITAALRRIYAEKKTKSNISEIQEVPAEKKITAAPEYRDVPFYSKSFEYAQEAGEVDLFRISRRENEKCAKAIDKYSNEFYRDYSYDSEAVLNAVISEFPPERVEYIAAANVASANYDGRLSRANIEWAENYMNGLPDEYRKMSGIYLRTHKGLLNMFAEAVYKYMENERVSEKAESRINEADVLRQQLVSKVKNELEDFLSKPNGASGYQINMKKDIADFIIGNDNLELSDLQYTTLLSRPHVLSELYEEWRSSDIDEWDEEVMTAFISDTASSIAESIERNSESPAPGQAQEIDSGNTDEISEALDLAHNHITFSVISIEGEKPVVTGTTYVDSEDITELDEYQNYILKTGKKHADVTVEYYDIGNDGSESFPAEDGEASYIQEHLDEVIRHSGCINLETNTFSVNTPGYLLEEYAQEQAVVGRKIDAETAFQMWENGFAVYADGKAIDGYDFKNYDNVIKVSEIFRDESISFSAEEKDIETNALIDTVAEAVMEFSSEYVSLDYVIDSADWLVSGFDGDPYNRVRNAVSVGDFKPVYEFMDEVRERISEDDSSGINRWDGASEALEKLRKIMPQYLGRDSFTAYYYFPEGFSNDSLWRIRRQSEEYAIAAPTAAISDDFMSENNFHFYKIGRDIHGSFADFDSRKMFDILSDRHLLETAKVLSKEAGKPFTDFAYDEAGNKTEEEFDRMKELYAADIFRIYQVKSGEDYHYKRFANLDELNEAPNIADYDLVYTGNLSDYYGVNGTPGEFDSIFAAFNLNRPDDFTGRSMSTSDVLVLHGDTPYYVDSIGYKMLNKDFLISRDTEKETPEKNEPVLSDINVVTPEKIGEVIETREPRDMFLAQEGDRWVGVDNRTGDAWTEDFGTKDEAVRWLNGEEIDEISKTDKEEISPEKETQKSEPYEPKIGDKFIDKRGEEWELISLTGVLPWYTDQCAIRNISGGFSVEKNETYTNLLDPAKYTRAADVPEKPEEIFAPESKSGYTPKIGDMIDINDSLLTVADISGDLITFTDSETLFAEQSRMTFADFYAQDFSVVSEAAVQDEPAEDISEVTSNADVPVEHNEYSMNGSRVNIENLAQLKRALKVGAEFEMTNYARSGVENQLRRVNYADTTGFYTVRPDAPEDEKTNLANNGRGVYLDWGKSGDWDFSGAVCTLYAKGAEHTEENKILSLTVTSPAPVREMSAEKKPPQRSDDTLYTYNENDPDKSKTLLRSVTFDLTPNRERQPEKQSGEIDSGFWSSKDYLVDSERGQNYVITDENLGAAAPKARYRANIEAIKTLKEIEHKNLSLAADMFRPPAASPEQQEILSRYTGWGAIPQVFDSSNKDWSMNMRS